jgi:hypothetical protein
MTNRTSGRVIIPSNPEELLELASKVYKKHQDDGDASPLKVMQDNSWDVEGPKIENCLNNHEKAEEHARLAEQYYRERDKDLPFIRAVVQNSSTLLKSIHAKNPKILGNYGFEVDDTKQIKKK